MPLLEVDNLTTTLVTDDGPVHAVGGACGPINCFSLSENCFCHAASSAGVDP